jgi:hypothetical protein
MSRLVTAAIVAAACLRCSDASAQVTTKSFQLISEAKFLDCFATTAPIATVTVSRAGKRDKLVLDVSGLKPGLHFDVFTVQRSNLLANGTVDPNFANFGLAWYQSDLTADQSGNATTTLTSVFVDQIFGFDPDVALTPVNTFHIGFWFDNPAKAKRCGFTGNPTPFNGEHQAGPAAMISTPNATTGLGPLCLNPSSSSPSGCEN